MDWHDPAGVVCRKREITSRPTTPAMPIICVEGEHAITPQRGFERLYCGLICRELGTVAPSPHVWVKRFTFDGLRRTNAVPEVHQLTLQLTSTLPRQLIESYRVANRHPVDLLPYFRVLTGRLLTGENEEFEADLTSIRHPAGSGEFAIHFAFSGIGFHDGYALLYHHWSRGSEWGCGLANLLHREDGKWCLVDEQQLWIS
jgi:hypothetical protein